MSDAITRTREEKRAVIRGQLRELGAGRTICITCGQCGKPRSADLDPGIRAFLLDLRADIDLAITAVEIGAVPGPAAVKRMREHVKVVDEITKEKPRER